MASERASDPTCTCPSGDGSLRWPCPKHPPAAAPAEMSPEFTDTARAAIAWVLWHHQGASSPVGQPLRFALGMGADEPLPDWRIAEAKRYAAWAGATTAKFHEARAITPAAPGIGLAALAAKITDHLCEQEYDIGGRDELLQHVREAIDASPKGAAPGIDLGVPGATLTIDGKTFTVDEVRAALLIDASPKGAEAQQAAAQAMVIALTDGYRWNGQRWQRYSPDGALIEHFGAAEGLGSTTAAARSIRVPAGWALVPDRMQLTPENMELLADTLRGADEDEPWCGGVLWIGQTTDDDGEPTYYGLNVGNVECLEEGSINIVEFDPPADSPKGGSEAPAVENVAEDTYHAIAEVLRTEGGWSVLEHVEYCRELIWEARVALGRDGANADTNHRHRGLWVKLGRCLEGFAPGSDEALSELSKCDCQNPCPETGAALVSMACPIHNDLPAAQAGDAEVRPLCDLCRKRPEAHSDAEGIGFCEDCWDAWVQANSHGAGVDRG